MLAGDFHQLREGGRNRIPVESRVGNRLADDLAYPPRAMRAERAAAYLDMSKSKFLELVDEGVMPPPVKYKGLVSWDRLDLDAAYEDWKRGTENTVHALLRGIKDNQNGQD